MQFWCWNFLSFFQEGTGRKSPEICECTRHVLLNYFFFFFFFFSLHPCHGGYEPQKNQCEVNSESKILPVAICLMLSGSYMNNTNDLYQSGNSQAHQLVLHQAPPIMSTVELKLVSMFPVHGRISIKHASSRWQFLDPNLCTNRSNIGVQIDFCVRFRVAYLRSILQHLFCSPSLSIL